MSKILNIKHEFTFIADDAHGWLKVPKNYLNELDISPTPWSYQDNEHVYLEEDCDAPKFIKAWGKKFSTPLSINKKRLPGLCYIRNFYTFKKETV